MRQQSAEMEKEVTDEKVTTTGKNRGNRQVRTRQQKTGASKSKASQVRR